MKFDILTGLSPLNNVVPENEPSVENLHGEGDISDLMVTSMNNLVSVDDLETEEKEVSTESIDVDISIESLNTDETANAVPSNSVKKALQKLQQATGLNFDQPQPKPPPSIHIDKGVCRAYLQGMCYLTLAPLIHLLANGAKDDKFVIEIDLPYLSTSDCITLASTIEHCESYVTVAVRRIQSTETFMLLEVADEAHIAPNVHVVGPMTGFTIGTSVDMSNTTEAFKEHEQYVQELLKDNGFFTEDQLEEINTKAKSVRFTTEELLSRLKKEEVSED